MDKLIGQPLRRMEDFRLLTGGGNFADDLNRDGQLYASFARSPHAHGDIIKLDMARAAASPGVLLVLSGEDYTADGLGPLLHNVIGPDHLDITRPGFTPDDILLDPIPEHFPIAKDRVRHVGEIVAMVIAETPEAAAEAAERLEIDYAPLPAVTDARAALEDGAPETWPGGNLVLRADKGDAAAVNEAFAGAAQVIDLGSLHQRIHGTPVEPRAAVGDFVPATGRFTLYAPSQGVHRHQMAFMQVFGVEKESVRIVTGDVGGGFGVRTPTYSEYALVAWGAKRLGRPVKWTSSRQEMFLSDFQARDVYVRGRCGLDGDGHILAVDLDYIGNLGAYPASFAVFANILRMAGGVYDIPVAHVAVRGVFTNTVPMTVLRGAGRPESTFIVERMLDLAAKKMGLERDELRRRNLIAPDALPYQSHLGHVYETGTFAANMARLQDMLDWNGFALRRDAAKARGRLAGIGIANYLESPTGAPHERGEIAVLGTGNGDGQIVATLGTQDSGQGHGTAFAQVVADMLEVPFGAVAIRFGDTDIIASGGGTHSDRSLRLGGTALVRASQDIIAEGRRRAAEILEAAEEDVTYSEGRFTISGTDRAIGLFEIANQAPLAATSIINERLHANPNGAGGAEVEIDPDTGAVEIIRYACVDDVGRIVNPMIVAGQVHGGIALGLGQALIEQIVYDQNGQLVTGSFLDYAMPRASDFPAFQTATNEQPAPSNPLGVKGAGECGTTPSSAALISAIADALAEFGVDHLEMPATPERIWRLIQNGRT
ncbi:MAG: xanthine dehydrogenase family protein molybdopterin-binding subunit [Rhodospirillaceae bacterium]|jgi:carbon-monoxide dehydrogenase large subunit|nr:xanthine dehydrogenase family protein molybdopterin-binding subunit [Rhodospirillaceae bacterium]MBT4115133.1 xanthine dehydrogenase family protein molybdopterin-binding subunit [Rhodospirillaceae bacterium]MBT4674355.1 xanthine dehydrogenase family protein molybdopterin-binding subunit [Rhodospirillaceae bacterium]MBT4717777.1 xanthine dehydrogenase family protein molybdopterin-binding subunit [Rhodospirillaceae bacterium]MBT4751347.1 xanthine dehydrogenase family protein molybdopterin-bind